MWPAVQLLLPLWRWCNCGNCGSCLLIPICEKRRELKWRLTKQQEKFWEYGYATKHSDRGNRVILKTEQKARYSLRPDWYKDTVVLDIHALKSQWTHQSIPVRSNLVGDEVVDPWLTGAPDTSEPGEERQRRVSDPLRTTHLLQFFWLPGIWELKELCSH